MGSEPPALGAAEIIRSEVVLLTKVVVPLSTALSSHLPFALFSSGVQSSSSGSYHLHPAPV